MLLVREPNPVRVAELALRLHQTDKPDLCLDLEPGTIVTDDQTPLGYKWTTDAIEFESLAERNRHVAEYVFKRLRERLSLEPDALYEQAYELWKFEIGHPDQASGRLLGMAANELDILGLGSRRIRGGADVLEVLHLVEAALPFVDALSINSLVDLCEAIHEKTKNDLAGGGFHCAIENWLTGRQEQALALHRYVSENCTDASASLLCNAILGVARSDYAAAVKLATADSGDASPLRAQLGVWTLGRLLLEEHAPAELHTKVTALIANIIESSDGDRRAQSIRAATSAMHNTRVFDALLKRLAEDGDQAVLAGVATAMFLKGTEMLARGDIHEWANCLTGLTPEFKGAIGDFDNALARLITQSAYTPLVIAILTTWVAKHGEGAAIDYEFAELFSDTLHKLWNMEAEWSALVTDWLLSDKREHAASLAGLLMRFAHGKHPPLRLSKSRLDSLPIPDLLFLARRMLGYVHDRHQVTSLALSMLQSKDAEERIFPVLHALLFDEIGYDYPDSTAKSCRLASESCPSENGKAFLNQIADKLEQIGKALSDLPQLNEFRSPMRLRRLFLRARAKQMNDSLEEARKKSVWRLIATEIPIKAGSGTFNYRDAAYGQSMKMSSYSHSIELPRREALDPIGNAIRLLSYRRAKRGES